MDLITLIHGLSATIALCLGPVWIIQRKNPRRWTIAIIFSWIALMALVSISSFWMRYLNDGSLSYIHILSVITIISIIESLYFYLRKKALFFWTKPLLIVYIGLVLAGVGTLLPGRIVNRVALDLPIFFGVGAAAYLAWLYFYVRARK